MAKRVFVAEEVAAPMVVSASRRGVNVTTRVAESAVVASAAADVAVPASIAWVLGFPPPRSSAVPLFFTEVYKHSPRETCVRGRV